MIAKQPSAIPLPYFIIHAWYEPLLCFMGMIGTLMDPKTAHDQQASWPGGKPPLEPLSQASLVSIVQLSHVCALLGLVNLFVLGAARKYLSDQPIIQEKIVYALFVPLLIGDIAHMSMTLWALGPTRFDYTEWSSLTFTTLVASASLFIPRVMWHLGIGRFSNKRDGVAYKKLQSI